MTAEYYWGNHQPDYEPEDSQGLPGEILNPRHFYAAYVFDRAGTRLEDVKPLIEQAQHLGYPIRYWWLSDAMDLQNCPDRLIVCIHHPSRSEDAGMDLYDALTDLKIEWDDLDAAALDEYCCFGKPVAGLDDVLTSQGQALFDPGIGK